MAAIGFFMLNRTDLATMHRALKLAAKGRGRVAPNPRVGAVIVAADGTVLGEGYHNRCGADHAEIAALKACAGKDTRGAALFVNLEPCCFQGKTPPCTDAILKAGIKRVVAGPLDPFPRVKGGGFKALIQAGVEVEAGVLTKESRYLNRGYFSVQEQGRSWCAVKVALSLDGKMASADGKSKWITGPQARKLAHAMRADHDGVLIGGGTIIADDPELTVRSVRGPNPIRVILAPHRGIPLKSKIANSVSKVKTLLVTDDTAQPEGFEIPGLMVVRISTDDRGMIDPASLLSILPRFGMLSLLVEGGAGVLSSFMQAGVVDEISVGIAPSVIGKGLSPFEFFAPDSWEGRPQYAIGRVGRLGDDIVLTYYREGSPFLPD